MSDPLVLALMSEAAPCAALAAGFEEEGVPLTIEIAEGTPQDLAREAAKQALLGLGLGGDAELATRRGEGIAGELEQDPPVHRRGLLHRVVRPPRPL